MLCLLLGHNSFVCRDLTMAAAGAAPIPTETAFSGKKFKSPRFLSQVSFTWVQLKYFVKIQNKICFLK